MWDFIKGNKVGIAIVIIAAVIGIGSIFITKTQDGPIEQLAEEVIELELHLPAGSVDFTPGTPIKMEPIKKD